MYNYLKEKNHQIIEIFKEQFSFIDCENLQNVNTEFPEEIEHGDVTTNIGMIMAKALKKSPKLIAEQLIVAIKNEIKEIEHAEIAGNGFINCKISKNKWLEIVCKINEEGVQYGSSDIGKSQKVNLEFCSANPTGPMHLGHIRGAIWGDVVGKILQFCGYKVDTEYYVNDFGGQIETLLESAFLRYKEALGEDIEIKPGFYPGEYLKKTGEELKEKFGGELKSSKEIRNEVIESMINMIKNDLSALGINFDNWTYESKILQTSLLDEAFDVLKSKDLIYKGVLERPKGSEDDEWEPREQQLFRSSVYGDDCDRAIQKSDGSYTYFAKDVAYHLDKIKRDYDWLILEVGVDHNGYKKRMTAAVQALSDNKQKFSFEFHNMVYILDDGVQQKMSKRSGKLVGAKEMIDLLGAGVLRFYLLSKKHDMELDFDIQKAQEMCKDNPYFYIQYAHARSCSILRNAEEEMDLNLHTEEFDSIIINDSEIKLIKKLAVWPRCVELACEKLEPHRVNFYLQQLAKDFHGLWNLGNNDESLRFINKNDYLMTKYRINLVKATTQVIANGLRLLGVEPLEKM